LRAGRQLSSERSFNASEGEVVSFSCHAAQIWPRYIASLVRPDLGISLKQDVEPPRSDVWWAAISRWIPHLYIGFAGALVPWTVYLAVSLPRRSVSEHYRGTWVFFDVALILVLARTGWLVQRRNPKVVLIATAGSTLLMVDAWFDVTTAAAGSAHVQAILSAVFLELPAAVLCGMLARRALRVLVSRAEAPATAQNSG
jgi:hypothetical protein